MPLPDEAHRHAGTRSDGQHARLAAQAAFFRIVHRPSAPDLTHVGARSFDRSGLTEQGRSTQKLQQSRQPMVDPSGHKFQDIYADFPRGSWRPEHHHMLSRRKDHLLKIEYESRLKHLKALYPPPKPEPKAGTSRLLELARPRRPQSAPAPSMTESFKAKPAPASTLKQPKLALKVPLAAATKYAQSQAARRENQQAPVSRASSAKAKGVTGKGLAKKEKEEPKRAPDLQDVLQRSEQYSDGYDSDSFDEEDSELDEAEESTTVQEDKTTDPGEDDAPVGAEAQPVTDAQSDVTPDDPHQDAVSPAEPAPVEVEPDVAKAADLPINDAEADDDDREAEIDLLDACLREHAMQDEGEQLQATMDEEPQLEDATKEEAAEATNPHESAAQNDDEEKVELNRGIVDAENAGTGEAVEREASPDQEDDFEALWHQVDAEGAAAAVGEEEENVKEVDPQVGETRMASEADVQAYMEDEKAPGREAHGHGNEPTDGEREVQPEKVQDPSAFEHEAESAGGEPRAEDEVLPDKVEEHKVPESRDALQEEHKVTETRDALQEEQKGTETRDALERVQPDEEEEDFEKLWNMAGEDVPDAVDDDKKSKAAADTEIATQQEEKEDSGARDVDEQQGDDFQKAPEEQEVDGPHQGEERSRFEEDPEKQADEDAEAEEDFLAAFRCVDAEEPQAKPEEQDEKPSSAGLQGGEEQVAQTQRSGATVAEASESSEESESGIERFDVPSHREEHAEDGVEKEDRWHAAPKRGSQASEDASHSSSSLEEEVTPLHRGLALVEARSPERSEANDGDASPLAPVRSSIANPHESSYEELTQLEVKAPAEPDAQSLDPTPIKRSSLSEYHGSDPATPGPPGLSSLACSASTPQGGPNATGELTRDFFSPSCASVAPLAFTPCLDTLSASPSGNEGDSWAADGEVRGVNDVDSSQLFQEPVRVTEAETLQAVQQTLPDELDAAHASEPSGPAPPGVDAELAAPSAPSIEPLPTAVERVPSAFASSSLPVDGMRGRRWSSERAIGPSPAVAASIASGDPSADAPRTRRSPPPGSASMPVMGFQQPGAGGTLLEPHDRVAGDVPRGRRTLVRTQSNHQLLERQAESRAGLQAAVQKLKSVDKADVNARRKAKKDLDDALQAVRECEQALQSASVRDHAEVVRIQSSTGSSRSPVSVHTTDSTQRETTPTRSAA